MALPPPPNMADTGAFPQAPSVAPSVNPSAGASPVPAQSDPGVMEDMKNIIAITSAARQLALKYPAAIPDVDTIAAAIQSMQNKILQQQQPPEMAAPPQ